jgi:hypothetical protein
MIVKFVNMAIGKDMEWSDDDLILGTIPKFAFKNWGKPQKNCQSGRYSGQDFNSGHLESETRKAPRGRDDWSARSYIYIYSSPVLLVLGSAASWTMGRNIQRDPRRKSVSTATHTGWREHRQRRLSLLKRIYAQGTFYLFLAAKTVEVQENLYF